jgi:hypothetical protein
MRINLFRGQPGKSAPDAAERLTPAEGERDAFFRAVTVARALSNLIPANEFLVIRDPRTGVPVTVVRYRGTAELIDICLPDHLIDILKYLPGQGNSLSD